MSGLKIGWAENEFVFEKPIALAGQFAERISQYTEKPLTATAFAVEQNGEQMVLCSVDLVSVSCSLLDRVRELLAENTLGLDPMKVVVSAIHTHTGPKSSPYAISRTAQNNGTNAIRAMLEKELPAGKKYVEKVPLSHNTAITSGVEVYRILSEAIAKTVLEAWEARTEGALVNAFGRAAVGMCRRAAYNDGTAQMWGDTHRAVFSALEGGSDTGIELMYVFDRDGKLTGVIANLACPAQCVQHRLFISPDFWGEAKKLLRERFGQELFLLALCSAAGDQCPVDLVRWVEPESDVHDPNLKRTNPPKRKADPSMFDLAGMKKAGRRVAREIIDVYEEGLDGAQSDVPLIHEVKTVALPLRRATLTEEKTARKAIRDYLRDKPGDVDYNDVAALQIHLGILARMELQERLQTVPAEVHVIRLGSVAIATNPFELFLDYGNQIRARSNAEQTFLIQLANGAEGYLPTEKAEKNGHYSAIIGSGYVGHEGGELLVSQTLESINKLF